MIETVEERVDALPDDRIRETLVRVIKTLIENGTGMAVSDVLYDNCLLTVADCRAIYMASFPANRRI